MYASVARSVKLGLENNWTIVFVRYGNRKTMMIIITDAILTLGLLLFA